MSTYGYGRSGRSGLARPREGRIIAGVCAGLARRFGTSVMAFRLLFIVLAILPPSSLLVYIVLWVVMPNES
ncbi:PspC domain-containing protein [Actinobacteria bacterium YIM 96077]|uniref:PspC domain-containing protein n=1 Tax=Phytoactinopolyspora halophila TaxID=1981511 RepID=A0A329QP34_9ACTN|nr:PspC domain-containing protein [Phytoactinopolyspora halophila]AYY15688.1 PspC domain-containing protein [Actinobacteria bacterium YIM 96077]RAW14125.1 PspC domain-containing protein [Phytoactinopolyspora halophila]